MRSAARQRLYKCRECKAVYSDAEELWRHIRAEHGPIQYLYCRQCQYRATCRETVRKHYRSYHPGCEAEAESVKAEIERTGQTPRVALVRADGQPASPKQSAESEESGVPASTPLLPDVDHGCNEDVLSLSPCPMSPLLRSPSPLASAPRKTPPLPLTGKPRGMLQITPPDASPASTASSMPELEADEAPDVDPEPPRKMIKMATVKEHVTKDVIVEGRVVSREETTKMYFTKVTVDEDNHLVVS